MLLSYQDCHVGTAVWPNVHSCTVAWKTSAHKRRPEMLSVNPRGKSEDISTRLTSQLWAVCKVRPCFSFPCCCSVILFLILYTGLSMMGEGGNFTASRGTQGCQWWWQSSYLCPRLQQKYNFWVMTPKWPVKVAYLKMEVTVVLGPFYCKEQLCIDCFLSIVWDVLFWCGWGRRPDGVSRFSTCGVLWKCANKSKLTWQETR